MIFLSSTNKTPHLRLNSWIGGDVPKRTDFVSDNAIIDTVVGEHNDNTQIHISQSEREKWNAPYYIGKYMGTGQSTNTVTFDAGFKPKWGILFSVGTYASVNDYNNKADYNYFAVFSEKGSMDGVTLGENSITVTQSTISILGTEYKSFNENGETYVFILFR